MNSPHIVAYINAIILIAAGLFSFFSNPERPPTAMIGPIVGLIIAAMAPAMKKGSKTAAHILVGLTFVFAVTTAVMAYNSGKIEDNEKRERRIIVFVIMSLSSFGAAGYYIARFVKIKQSQKQLS